MASQALAASLLPPISEISSLSAIDLATAIRRRYLSAREVMTAHLTQIDRLNSRFNAIVSRVLADRLLRTAAASDEDDP